MKKQITYMAPAIEIIAMQNEGSIMTGSNSLNMPEGGETNPFSSPTGNSGGANVQSASSIQEVEDLLNDIFTVSK
ncbi:hypothetical protein D0T50_04890 [Bacteroides sp. 214]|uniref:hypothetical protein n=1 Tax=Bacteroides sp. 214 TaxID=2302935 RepID=UPI0013D04EBD|nr:hypothetical protein [Bacteroides sp. 214]NDW12225.1 hypothetical protein [Bacteroides sp. 214]